MAHRAPKVHNHLHWIYDVFRSCVCVFFSAYSSQNDDFEHSFHDSLILHHINYMKWFCKSAKFEFLARRLDLLPIYSVLWANIFKHFYQKITLAQDYQFVFVLINQYILFEEKKNRTCIRRMHCDSQFVKSIEREEKKNDEQHETMCKDHSACAQAIWISVNLKSPCSNIN